MLSPEEREEIKQLIIAQIKENEASLESLRSQVDPIAPDNAIGRLSRMDSLVNKSTAEHALANVRKKLNRLHGKLERIDAPDFGHCANCNAFIGLERLRAAPDRGVCLKCLREQGK